MVWNRSEFLDVGLPFYGDIYRKPEYGCEIQNIADGEGGFMLGMPTVKSKDKRNDYHPDSSYNWGTKIFWKITEPWSRSNRRFCADSFFASFKAACALYIKIG